MANEILTTLHPDQDPDTNLYPNIKKQNIPDGSVSEGKLDPEYVKKVNDQIYNLEGGSPRYVNTSTNILSLTENMGVAVATDTGHWYYWDGSQYVDGGVYQTAINYDEIENQINELSGDFGVDFVIGDYEDLLNDYQKNWLVENYNLWHNTTTTLSIGSDGVISIVYYNNGTYDWYILTTNSYQILSHSEGIYKDNNNYEILYLYGKNGYVDVSSTETIGLPKKLKKVKNKKFLPLNDVSYVVGGMDSGISNNDNNAIHTNEFLEITQNNVYIYSSNSDLNVVYQVFDENYNYIGYKTIFGSATSKKYSIKSELPLAKYVKICLFIFDQVVSTSKNYINNLNLKYWGLKRFENVKPDVSVLTKVYKASWFESGDKVIYERQGEGVIDQIQLIGAYDTTSTPKYAFWSDFYKSVLTIVVDGDIALQGTIYDLCGLSSQIINDNEFDSGIFENVNFSTPLFSKTGLYSGINFNFKIPYYNSVQIKINSSVTHPLWGMIKTLTNVDINIGGYKIPYGAKFHAITTSQNCTKGDQIEILNTNKNGMLLGINISGMSNAFDWVEGCIRGFKYGATSQDNCTMLSSGLEDYLGGAFGYNVGAKQFENWGCTLREMTSQGNYRLCGYRNHINDKIIFSKNGFKVTGRWGDQNEGNWDLSSTENFAGGGNPGTGLFVATAFYYDWE